MPPRGVKSAKRTRQYEHIKESEQERGVSEARAEEIAARTVNKQRREAGETKAPARKTAGRSASTRPAKRTAKKATRRASKKR
ncbi:hypothetical protein TBR22_A14570 [Luteitalea sp. TBR-22]|uniref:hypothetical protein n=1 Tax=Luteitalea sp. TBR-22 TaxID=2802971 RepID=UPI001AF36E27|nr:hypothetical protein [Luteitalea sp. TBR-22]BCS32247.1 hypothetical protein TBR22_A14570 [Luteitalea sp. TBR-22]